MNLRKYFVVTTLAIGVISMSTGCSLFGSEEDSIEISPSPVVSEAFPFQQIWSNSLSSNSQIYSQLSPTVLDNVVYAAGRNGQVKAIDITNGKTLWTNNLAKSSIFSSQSALLSGGVSADEKYVYIGSERAVIYTLDKNTGTIVWQKDINGEILAKPVSTENKVIVHSANGALLAFNREDGNQEWLTKIDVPTLSLRGDSTPTVAYGAIILGDDNGRVNAYFAKDGQLIWQQRISQPSGSTEIAKLNDVNATPIVEKGIVYAIGYNGSIAALDLSNGQIVWKKDLGSSHSLSLSDNRLFAVDQNDNVVAVSKSHGSELWKQADLLNRQLTDPVVYKDYVVVGDFDGYMYLLNINNGDILAKTMVNSSGLQSRPIVSNDKLIIQAKNGEVYAFGSK